MARITTLTWREPGMNDARSTSSSEASRSSSVPQPGATRAPAPPRKLGGAAAGFLDWARPRYACVMSTDGLRLATEGDAPAIADIYAPSVTSSVASFEPVAPKPRNGQMRDVQGRIRCADVIA